jgi:GT2 family glycosyltransferase
MITELSASTTKHAPATRVRHVTVILVNWNGWRDTILCLQSLFATVGPSFDVIVCDNGSTDGSLDNISMWASGLLSPWVSSSHPARSVVELSARPRTCLIADADTNAETPSSAPQLLVIPTGANLGFGGGNNVGISWAKKRGTSDYVWLLNNDTTVLSDTLSELVTAVEEYDTRVLASSRVMLMMEPQRVWFEGGVFRSLTATAHHVTVEEFERSRTGFLSGCALLIGKHAWESLGLLDDRRFFMYGEDIDYSMRAREAGIALRVVRTSIVLHAVSATSQIASPFAYYHNVSSVIRVARKHFKAWRVVPVVAYHVLKLAALAIVRRPGRHVLGSYWRGILRGLA